jgi:ATP-dependent DNA ligase
MGKTCGNFPSLNRKKRLRQLIGESDCERIIYVQHIEMCGCLLYRAICKKELEGIICKKKNGTYSVSGQWLKVLNPNWHEIFTAPQKTPL